MDEEAQQKLFISYSHEDTEIVEDFVRYIQPLKRNKGLEIWYDKNIKAGEIFRDKISEALKEKDIILLFLSPNYLASESCLEEKREALKNKDSKKIIPIIVTNCGWKDEDGIKDHLALPTDGDLLKVSKEKRQLWKIFMKI